MTEKYYPILCMVCCLLSQQMVYTASTVDLTCPTKCMCTGTNTNCLYKDITTAELIDMVPHIPENTKKLSLIGNKITMFPTEHFRMLKDLEYLLLSYNSIEAIPKNLSVYFPRLQALYLVSNQIKSISSSDFTSLSSVKIIALDNNSIETIPDYTFSKMSNLEELLLRKNRLSKITKNTFHGLHHLTKLHLDNNQLVTLHGNIFQNLVNLKKIFLNTNKIKTLPKEIFSGLQNLRTIYLSGNKIEQIDDDLFDRLSVDEIYFESNFLTTLPVGLFNRTKIDSRVYLRYNKFMCDCKLALRLSIYMKNLTVENKLVLGECNLPNRFKGHSVEQVINSKRLNCTMCDLEPCQRGETCSTNLTTGRKYTCTVGSVGPIMDQHKDDVQSSDEETEEEYVIYVIIAICIICVIGITGGAYFLIVNRRKRQAFDVSTLEQKRLYEDEDSQKHDPKLTGLTSKDSFKIVNVPTQIKPEFV